MSTLSELEGQDYVYVSEIQDRVDELEELLSGLDELEKDDFLLEQSELDDLKDVLDEVDTDEVLINSDVINDYLDEMLEDTGELPKDLPTYITAHIDWEGVYKDLLMDFTYVNIGDSTFYYRSY